MLSQGTVSLLLYDNENQARADALKHEMQEGTLAIKLVPDFAQQPRAKPININSMPELSGDRKAMMLFTSGTVSQVENSIVARY